MAGGNPLFGRIDGSRRSGGFIKWLDEIKTDLGNLFGKSHNGDFLDFTFNVSGVGIETFGQIGDGIGSDNNPLFLSFLKNNGGAHFKIGRLDVNGKSAYKTRNKTVF